MSTLGLLGVSQLRTKAVDGLERCKQKNKFKKVKNITFHPRVISTKFCMVIEVVRAIILGPKTFLAPIHSFAARGHRKFG